MNEGGNCPRCSSENITTSSGYTVCEDCGLVLDDTNVSVEKEWRAFDVKQLQKKSRSSTSKEIEKHYAQIWEEGGGKGGVPPNFSRGRKLRKVRREIKRIADKLRLSSNVRETAERIILKYLSKKNIRSKKLPATTGAALYISARKTGRPKPIDKFVKKTDIQKKGISKGYSKIREVLSLKVNPPKPEKYIVSFGQDLSLSGHCIQLAKKIIKRARDKRLILGKDPSGLAAASIYLATLITNERRDHKEIAETAAITHVTVVSRYRELKNDLKKFLEKNNLEIPD